MNDVIDTLESQPWYQGEDEQQAELDDAARRTMLAELAYYEILSHWFGNRRRHQADLDRALLELDAAREAEAEARAATKSLENSDIPYN